MLHGRNIISGMHTIKTRNIMILKNRVINVYFCHVINLYSSFSKDKGKYQVVLHRPHMKNIMDQEQICLVAKRTVIFYRRINNGNMLRSSNVLIERFYATHMSMYHVEDKNIFQGPPYQHGCLTWYEGMDRLERFLLMKPLIKWYQVHYYWYWYYSPPQKNSLSRVAVITHACG